MEQAIETVKNFTPEMSEIEIEDTLMKLYSDIDPITGKKIPVEIKKETTH